MRALLRRGFLVPEAIRQIPEGTNVDRTKFYDQIAVHRRRGHAPKVEVLKAGVFDFFDHVFRDRERHPDAHDEAHLAARMRELMPDGRRWSFDRWRTYQMSDHLPMWVELGGGDEVLRGALEDA